MLCSCSTRAAPLQTGSQRVLGDCCRVLCSGFSLGAALANLCGPWAQATFPNVGLAAPFFSALTVLHGPASWHSCCPAQAAVEVVTAGSPRVFNPAAAKWYNAQVQNNYRVVNNKDIVPSVPFAQMGCVHSAQDWPCVIGTVRSTCADGKGCTLNRSRLCREFGV